jgi:hypothetical protein
MKKSIVLVLVALICISAVFASGNSIKASVVPYGLQITTSSAAGQDSVNSKYGFGLNVAYQYQYKHLIVEAGFAWDTFLMPDNKPALTSILAFAGIGCKYAFNDKFACSASVDVGTDTLIYNSKVSENITVIASLDASYALNDTFEVLIGCKGTFGFAKKNSVNYVNYRVLPMLGVNFNF